LMDGPETEGSWGYFVKEGVYGVTIALAERWRSHHYSVVAPWTHGTWGSPRKKIEVTAPFGMGRIGVRRNQFKNYCLAYHSISWCLHPSHFLMAFFDYFLTRPPLWKHPHTSDGFTNMASVKILVQDSYWLRAEGLVWPYSGAVDRGNEKPLQQ
jgi:hypothetical protein